VQCRGLFWAADRAKAARNRALGRAVRGADRCSTARMRPRSPSRSPAA